MFAFQMIPQYSTPYTSYNFHEQYGLSGMPGMVPVSTRFLAYKIYVSKPIFLCSQSQTVYCRKTATFNNWKLY